MQGMPHFITWTTEFNNRTWCACYPAEPPPFNLVQMLGEVDGSGVWRSSTLTGVFVDGLKVETITIEPDLEIRADQSMIDTVKISRKSKKLP